MLEAHHFISFTDLKNITYALQHKQDECSQQQFNCLDIFAQFATDIRHISGQGNVFADALSHVESVTAPQFYGALAASQDSDDEPQTLLESTTVLQLQKLPIPGTTIPLL
jgi:hypothetical protein